MSQFITLNFEEVQGKIGETLPHPTGKPAEKWLIAVNPDTLAARLVERQADGFVPDVEGHEDLFPVSMLKDAVAHNNGTLGFLPGGDWAVAHTPELRPHDGEYRSYWVRWTPST